MTKRTERGQRRQAENEAGLGRAPLVEPMLAEMTTTRQHLLAWVHAQGLAALDELFRAEAVALAGPKGRHHPQRTHHHWGRRQRSSLSGAGACRCISPACGRRPAWKRRCPRWRRFA